MSRDMSNSNSTSACVLIVEDEVLVRMFAVDALEDAGFRVEQAGNGADAMAKVRQLQSQLSAVVIDLGLPDRSGDEVAAEIRGALALVPILIASGRSEKELKERFAVDSRVGIMVKPYTGPMLIESLAVLGVVGTP
jgi:CheY-like chemotaxis protein